MDVLQIKKIIPTVQTFALDKENYTNCPNFFSRKDEELITDTH